MLKMRFSTYLQRFACAGLLSLLTACSSSFLEEEVLDQYSPESLTDRLAFEAAVVGLHNHFSTLLTHSEDQTRINMWQVGTDIVWAPAGRSNGGARPYFDYAQMNSQDGAALAVWQDLYELINNANNLIYGTENNEIPDMTQEELDGYSAEARFFRAYAYHMLVTLWGGVPIIPVPLTEAKTDFVRAPVNEVDQLIEDDLLFAVASLPPIGSAAYDARANQAMARQLLAEAYLRMDEPGLAEAQCDAIIDGSSGSLSLVTERYGVKASEPGDPFSDMFIYGNQRRAEGNTEAIWVLEVENPTDVPGGSTNFPQQRRNWVAGYYDIRGMLPADSLGGRGIARLRLNDWVVYRLYEADDMRNSQYNIRRQLYFNDPNPLYDPIRGQAVPYGENQEFILSEDEKVEILEADTVWRIAPYTTKWGHFDERDSFGFGMWKDFILMRLGETYLLRAEARFKQNDLAGAAADINMIRERAGASLVQAGDIDLDFILDERARELLAEENRRMTLVRTGTLVERATTLSGTAPRGDIETTNGLTEKHLLLPIPQEEIDLNKDAVLEQNPGY